MKSAKGRNRTGDTSIFSAVLYRLSYLGVWYGATIACPALPVNTLENSLSGSPLQEAAHNPLDSHAMI
jgi:hypothetical protein